MSNNGLGCRSQKLPPSNPESVKFSCFQKYRNGHYGVSFPLTRYFIFRSK
ncbi:hypothetical protein PVAP13_9KG045757 [Panicum virgatum]|uniref:Uncharacterized protein n=1 Tax=Panicum virgatum TaxID=38727 RepID=A0A8T0NI79_PANVG|nr:hypothetical protein PVAP13_9KG045757 [Panicum virgatum]